MCSLRGSQVSQESEEERHSSFGRVESSRTCGYYLFVATRESTGTVRCGCMWYGVSVLCSHTRVYFSHSLSCALINESFHERSKKEFVYAGDNLSHCMSHPSGLYTCAGCISSLDSLSVVLRRCWVHLEQGCCSGTCSWREKACWI